MAMLPVLFILLVVGLIAGFLVKNQAMDIRLTANFAEQIQARHYALGVETMAKQILRNDLAANKVDYAKEEWHGSHDFKIDNAKVNFVIDDLQGKFNLNNLIKDKTANSQQAVDEKALKIFTNILQAENISEKISDAFLDWLDEDENTRKDGAEDREYIAFGTPPFYKAANAMMVDTSEMRLIRGVDEHDYTKLLTAVTSLPEHNTRININTAPDFIIKAAVESESSWQRIMEAKGNKSFIDETQLNNILPNNEIFGVSSQYFIVYSNAHYGNADIHLISILYREAGQDKDKAKIEVVARKFVKRFDL